MATIGGGGESAAMRSGPDRGNIKSVAVPDGNYYGSLTPVCVVSGEEVEKVCPNGN